MGRKLKTAVVVCATMGSTLLCIQGEAQEYNAFKAYEQHRDSRVTQLEKAQTTTHRSRVKRLEGKGFQAYVHQGSGVPLLTNAPKKYSRKADYTELTINVEPIKLPSEYLNRADFAPTEIAGIITHYSKLYGMDESLIYAVIRAESNFDRYAVSPAGARGLMQLMPGTAAELGVKDVFNPAENIAGGTQYLRRCLDAFGGNLSWALAGYNAGPNNVKKYNGVPPFKETKNYIQRVTYFNKIYANKNTRPSPVLVARNDVPTSTELPLAHKKYYTIYFHSGLTQPAESIIDHERFYFISFQGRTVPIRKDHVKEIVAPA